MPALFVDFDGTISARETFASILKTFAPELSAELLPQMMAETLPLRVGVRRLLESIESRRWPEIIDHVRDDHVREGFVELLDLCEARGVPLVVVSGGLRGVIDQVLGPLAARVAGIYALDVDLSGPRLIPRSPYEGGTEMVAKVAVMRDWPTDQRVAIGDSITDVEISLQADLVFARDRLCGYLDARGRPYVRWENFHDVRLHLEELWAGDKP